MEELTKISCGKSGRRAGLSSFFSDGNRSFSYQGNTHSWKVVVNHSTTA